MSGAQACVYIWLEVPPVTYRPTPAAHYTALRPSSYGITRGSANYTRGTISTYGVRRVTSD